MLAALVVVALSVAGVPPAEPSRQVRPAEAPSVGAGAYYEFVLGRHLEGEGDIDGAIAAYERAARADPKSAEVRAELAGLYARQNRAEEATAAAKHALALDPDNAEANWVLGTIYAASVQGRQELGSAVKADDLRPAIAHLEKARPNRLYDLGLVLTLGRLYLALPDPAKAVEALNYVFQREPGVSEAGYLLAQAHDAAGNREAAIHVLQETVASEPRYSRAWMLMGELLERSGKYTEAAAAYGQAARQSARPQELTLRQASALLAGDAAAAARTILLDYVTQNPTEPMGLSLLAEAQRQERDYDGAEATARRLIALEPSGIRGPYALAQVYEGRRDYARVVEVLAPVAAAHEKDGRVSGSRAFIGLLARLGYAYQETGRFDEAIATFERAKQLAPADGLADLYMSQAYLTAGQYDKAIEIARAGRTLRPDDDRFARLEAQALRENGRSDEAAAVLRDQMRKGGDQLALSLALATVYSEAKRYDEAQRVLDDAEKAHPDALDVPFQRGALFEQQKNYAEAERVFRALLQRDPLHAPTLNYLGYMLADRGEKVDEAIGLIERALTADPHNGSYLDSLGWAWFKKGDPGKAREYLARASEQLPRNSVVQDHWGDVLHALGDREAALAAWQRALDGDRDQVDPEAIKAKMAGASRER